MGGIGLMFGVLGALPGLGLLLLSVRSVLPIGGACEIVIKPLKPELNPICYLLSLLGAHHFLHVSRIRVKLLTLR